MARFTVNTSAAGWSAPGDECQEDVSLVKIFIDVDNPDISSALIIALMLPVSTARGSRKTRLYGPGNR